MKWSDGFVALVPPGAVTVTSTTPTTPGGEVAVTMVGLRTERFEAALDPKVTALAAVRFVPVIVTVVPPAVDPEAGLTTLTVGVDPTP